MSRVGKIPVTLPDGVTSALDNGLLTLKGKLGELTMNVSEKVSLTMEPGSIAVKPNNDTQEARSHWGLTTRLITNMVQGVTEGFSIALEIHGVGYRSAVSGKILTLFLGYSHEIKYFIPKGIDIKCESPTSIVISGLDKQKVGQVAALIIEQRPVEPYKGKGIYKKKNAQSIRRKVRKK